MKKKLFLLIIFITPCLSWAKGTTASAKNKKARTPASMVQLCDEKISGEKKPPSIYKLDTKDQVSLVKSELVDIMKRQGSCQSPTDPAVKF